MHLLSNTTMKFQNHQQQAAGLGVPMKTPLSSQHHHEIQYDEETYVSDSEYEVVDDMVEEYTVVEEIEEEVEEEVIMEEEIVEEIIEEITDDEFDEDDEEDDEDCNSSAYDSDPPPDPNEDDADSVATEDIDGFMLSLPVGDTRVSCISMGDFLMDYGSRYNVAEFNSDDEEEDGVRDGLGSSIRSEISELGSSGRFFAQNFGPDHTMDTSRRSNDGSLDMSKRSGESFYNIQRTTPLGMVSPAQPNGGDSARSKKKKLGASLKIVSPQRPQLPKKLVTPNSNNKDRTRRKKPSILNQPPPATAPSPATQEQRAKSRKIRYVPSASNAASRRRGAKPPSHSHLRTSTSNLMSITETTEEMQNSAATFNVADLPTTVEDGNESDDSTKQSLPAQGYKKTKKVAPAAVVAKVGVSPPTAATKTTSRSGPKAASPAPATKKVGGGGTQVDLTKQKLPKRMDPPPSVEEVDNKPIRIPAQSLSADRRASFQNTRPKSTTSIDSANNKSSSSDRSLRKSRSKSPTSNRHRSKSPTSNRHRSKSSDRSSRSKSPAPEQEEDGTKLRRRLKTSGGRSSPTRGVAASKSMDSAMPTEKVSNHRRAARSTSPQLRLDDPPSSPKRNKDKEKDPLSSSSHRRKRDPSASSSDKKKDPLSSSSHRRKEKDPLSSSSHSGERRRQLRTSRSNSARGIGDSLGTNKGRDELGSSSHRRSRAKRVSRNTPKESKRVSRFSDLLTKMSTKQVGGSKQR